MPITLKIADLKKTADRSNFVPNPENELTPSTKIWVCTNIKQQLKQLAILDHQNSLQQSFEKSCFTKSLL